MTEKAFRKLALDMPDAVEGSHMDHADFRVGTGLSGKKGQVGRVFASLPEAGRGMVRVPSDIQARLLADDSGAFAPAPGAWGRQGCTFVDLKKAQLSVMKAAMMAAWRMAVPAKALAAFDRVD